MNQIETIQPKKSTEYAKTNLQLQWQAMHWRFHLSTLTNNKSLAAWLSHSQIETLLVIAIQRGKQQTTAYNLINR